MKFKFFKSLALVAMAVMLSLSTVACGMNPGGDDKGQTILRVQSANPLRQSWQSLLKSEKEGSELWNVAKFSQEFLEGFKEIRPDVKVNFQEDGWGESLYEKQVGYVRDYESRKYVTVDIMIGEPYMAYWTKRGIFKELDSSKFEDVIPGTYSDMVMDGKMYGVPLCTGFLGLQYNTNILSEAGIPENEWVPTTWDQLLNNSKKVYEYATANDKTYGGIMINNVAGMSSAFRAIPFLRQNGGDFVNENGELVLDSQENVETFTYLRELAKYAYKDSLTSATEDDLRYNFNSKNTAAYSIDGNFAMASAPEYIKSAKLPTSNENGKGNILCGNVLFGIVKGSKNEAVAEQFLEYVTSEKVQALLYKYDGRLPINAKTLQDEAIKEVHPNINSYLDELLEGNVKGGFPYFNKNANDIWSQWSNFYKSVLTGTDDVQGLVTGVQSGISAKMA